MLGTTKSTLCKFFLYPIRSGFVGFILFFIVLVITKSLSGLIGTTHRVTIDTEDLLLSAIGFVMFFLIKLLECFSGEKS